MSDRQLAARFTGGLMMLALAFEGAVALNAQDNAQTVTISGRVTAGGKPVPGIYVYSSLRVEQNGVVSLKPVQRAEPTDADGRYRLAGRPPGDYVISASSHLVTTPTISERRAPAPIDGPDGVKLGYLSTPYREPGAKPPAHRW